jgi:RNA polymerase sigma-70 factor (ECF subfamily)
MRRTGRGDGRFRAVTFQLAEHPGGWKPRGGAVLNTLELVRNPSLDDGEVVRRVLAGEVELFEVLLRRHDPRVYRTVRAILRDESEAEDAMQAAWLSAYQHLREWTGASSFTTWLLRISANEALGRLRRRGRLVSLEDPDDGEGNGDGGIMDPRAEDPEERAAAHETVRLLERAVDRLSAPYRSVYMLREIEQLSTAETAEALGLSEEAVKVRLHRARAMLRDDLGEAIGRAAPEAFPFLAPRCNRMVERVMATIAAMTTH